MDAGSLKGRSVRTWDVLSSITSYGSMRRTSVSGWRGCVVTMYTVKSSPRFSRTITGRFFAPEPSSKYTLAFQTSIGLGFPTGWFRGFMPR